MFVNLGHGHNGFLTAGLFGVALATLAAQAVLAGVLFGLLAYKPQFGLLIPLVLAGDRALARLRCRRRDRRDAGARRHACLFGVDVWSAFLASTDVHAHVVLEQGDTGWYKIQSVFAWAAHVARRQSTLAYALQGAVTLAVAAALDLALAQPARLIR